MKTSGPDLAGQNRKQLPDLLETDQKQAGFGGMLKSAQGSFRFLWLSSEVSNLKMDP